MPRTQQQNAARGSDVPGMSLSTGVVTEPHLRAPEQYVALGLMCRDIE